MTTSPATPYRALVIDDEPAARRGVSLLLKPERDFEVVGEAGDVIGALKAIRTEKPDLVFLDVQMPGGDGFDVLRQLTPDERPMVVFVTAYNQHALRAFEVHAVDYLLKPFDDARFAETIQRVREAFRSRQTAALSAKVEALIARLADEGSNSAPPTPPPAAASEGEGGAQDRILVKSSGEIIFLKPTEIDWIEAEGDYMKFHVGGKSHLMRETMARLESRLDPKRFVRIHRSTIVNLDRVRKLSPGFVGEYAVVLQDGTKLKLSRGYQDRLQTHLKALL
ncbi:LytR/AlgR family response regulator transcription factor [Actomonas aquatica]|uniref:LytTR family DNA-binding domain-containing protein n=1 Tax=Actomonas aquatica TaxID=2866162 RepID=A0ABZ1C5V9_9BACT|nr:LytTR family DNA-binding domain-containing protein [Opitutus sp. WL0086]WRQ86633.1 LytTR family DNA-binding domain-containing protein [Opitutus sp. WL0086]